MMDRIKYLPLSVQQNIIRQCNSMQVKNTTTMMNNTINRRISNHHPNINNTKHNVIYTFPIVVNRSLHQIEQQNNNFSIRNSVSNNTKSATPSLIEPLHNYKCR